MQLERDQLEKLAMVVAFGVAFLVLGVRLLRRRGVLARTPTRPVRSLRAGTAEVAGRALPFPPDETRRSLVQDLPCAFAAWRIEGQGQGSLREPTGARHAILEGNTGPFLVEDATGRVLVDPQGAFCEASMDIVLRSHLGRDPPPHLQAYFMQNGIEFRTAGGANHALRYLEFVVPEGGQVFVHGHARKDPRSLALLARRETATALTLAKGKRPFVIAAEEKHARIHDTSEAAWVLGCAALLLGLAVLAVLDLAGLL